MNGEGCGSFGEGFFAELQLQVLLAVVDSVALERSRRPTDWGREVRVCDSRIGVDGEGCESFVRFVTSCWGYGGDRGGDGGVCCGVVGGGNAAGEFWRDQAFGDQG